MKEKTLTFKVDTIRLLNEIADCALPKTMGILKMPLNMLRINLALVAERAIQLNDPILNEFMVNLGLYEIPIENSNEYVEKLLQVNNEANKQRKN